MDRNIYDMAISKNNNEKNGKRFASCLFSPVFVSVITASINDITLIAQNLTAC